MKKMKHWRLKSKEERRFKQGHPWVYSNELQESPKGVELGELVELSDASGNFLAYGFGHPSSLIAFRTISRKKWEGEFDEAQFLAKTFLENFSKALDFRSRWFTSTQSFRLIYGEADGLPGLIVDRYCGPSGMAYVVQPHSAGMDKNLPIIIEALQKSAKSFGSASEAVVILRRDAASREREGLAKEVTGISHLLNETEVESVDGYREFRFTVPGSMNAKGGKDIVLKADLISGQKTGFFFDQLSNIQLLESLLLRNRKLRKENPKANEPYRVLDLCSYIGQWSVHLTQIFSARECLPLEITLVDGSEPALKFAEENVIQQAKVDQIQDSVVCLKVRGDVLEPMPTLSDRFYNVVIADPPAFIKNRKSHPQGKHAYINLFTTAIQKTAPGGMVVCCSCSQLFSSEDMIDSLNKAARRAGRKVRWLAQGSPSIDHFQSFDFQEGSYLKAWIGQVD